MIHHCDFCEYKTKYMSDLKRHKARKHDIDVIWFKCDFCDYKTNNTSHLKRHQVNKHDIDVIWFKCDFCDYKSKSKCDLKRHQYHKHDIGVKWYYCDIDDCDFKTKDKSNIKQHKARKHDIDVIWYYCNKDVCDFKSKDKSSIIRHLTTCKGEDTLLKISYGEYRIKQILDEKMVDFKHNKTHYKLTNFCGKELRFDFIIFKDDYKPIVIEYNGIQHYRPKNFGSISNNNALVKFKIQQEHDQIKRDFCKDKGYNLVEIKYNENKNLDLIVLGSLNKFHDYNDSDYF